MVRERYQRELEELRQATVAMGEVVAERLKTGLSLLQNPDPEVVQALVAGDDEVDAQYLDIERRCVDLLALQQPVAGDLRLITASFKISTDIERIADLALNLGQYARDLHLNLQFLPDRDLFFQLGEQALTMLRDSLAAYRDRDAARAEAVVHADDRADRLFWQLTHHLIEHLMRTSRTCDAFPEGLATSAIGLLLAIRDLERVADHAVNIAARTVYMVEARSNHI
ncbi:phosphate signaling complex protein PhoU [Candidatus Bipolaricaulota bacterium]|nr:phosphate signaling complex protein PhoU [Candidatus Bipolaricaulota bacterium]